MLTVLFATRNRAAILKDCLAAFCALAAPPGGWELIVVDNGSTDGTDELLSGFRSRLPLTTVVESRPGKNLALNAGLRRARGDLLVFSDDDVFPRPDWLCRLADAAAKQAEYAIFGGRILPRWARPADDWLLRCVPLAPTFALTPADVLEGPTPPHNVFGPNMAIRAALFADGTHFDGNIGPSGKSYAMGSETELVRRLCRAGHRAWFAPDAVVEHLIREDQMDRRWVLERARRFGRGQYRLAKMSGDLPAAARTWFGIPRFLYRKALPQAWTVALATLANDPDRLFKAQWELNYLRGAMFEAFNSRSGRNA